MRPAIKATLRFSSTLARATAVTTIKPGGDPDPVGQTVDMLHQDEPNGGSAPRWSMLERHATDAAVEAILARVQTVMALPSTLDGSRVLVHRCYHDEDPPRPCEIDRAWLKAGGSVQQVM